MGPPMTTPKPGRGTAFGDFDNNGTVDVVVNNVNDVPDLFRLDDLSGNHWLTLKLVGTASNRSAIGARVRCTAASGVQTEEVRGGGSYISQNDLRVHFGLAAATKAGVEIRWPNGLVESFADLAADRIVTLTEGTGAKVPERQRD